MNFVVIGTDHRFQNRERGLEGLLRGWLGQVFCEPLTAIAEEYHEDVGESIGQRLAREFHLCWYNMDMTEEEKRRAGIYDEQDGRRKSDRNRRVPSDEIREVAWTEKLTSPGPGTTLVICGYNHLEPLVRKLRGGGCTVDQRVYLETVPDRGPE